MVRARVVKVSLVWTIEEESVVIEDFFFYVVGSFGVLSSR